MKKTDHKNFIPLEDNSGENWLDYNGFVYIIDSLSIV